MSKTDPNRRFIVRRQGNTVAIREVTPGTSAVEYTRNDAWATATRFAQPRKVKQPTLNIHFTGLNGLTTDLGPAVNLALKAEHDAEIAEAREDDKPEVTRSTVASDKQHSFANDLLSEIAGKPITTGVPVACDTREKVKRYIAAAIEVRDNARAEKRKAEVKEEPGKLGKVATGKHGVPAGRYAIHTEEGVKFYRVDVPTDGKWKGYTFVKVQASDDLYPVRGAGADKVLRAIAEDPEAASKLYGHELGKCGVCNRTLTDEASRAAGIGPVCAENVGW